MKTSVLEKKVNDLYEQSMPQGGLRAFRTNFEQSIGVLTDDDGLQTLDESKKEVDYKEFNIGSAMEGMLGSSWKKTFEQNWREAATNRLYFEGVGNAILPGALSRVSAALDVIAGLANARTMERPRAPKWIFDEMCEVREIMAQGGYDILTRSDGTKPNRDMTPGQQLPTAKMVGTKLHRNRCLHQGVRTKVEYHTIMFDLTSSLYDTVDENSDQVLLEREQKVADAAMGVSAATTLGSAETIGQDGVAMPCQWDGLTFFPYQNGWYGTNANATTVSESRKYVANYANCYDTDGVGLTDYTAFVRALQMMCANRDPFTGLAPDIESLEGMTMLVSPAAKVQLEYILQGMSLWQIANSGFTTSGGTATVSENVIKKFVEKLVVKSSQTWFNRLVDIGLMSVSSAGAVTHKAFTNANGDKYSTAGSIMSAYFLGDFKKAIKYQQIQPFNVKQVVPCSIDVGEGTVIIQDVQEEGQAYIADPRAMYRAFA